MFWKFCLLYLLYDLHYLADCTHYWNIYQNVFFRIKNKTPLPSTSTSESQSPKVTPAKLVEAPTFYPTEKEFEDPLEYIDSITPLAEKFGLCRVVPPSNFKVCTSTLTQGVPNHPAGLHNVDKSHQETLFQVKPPTLTLKNSVKSFSTFINALQGGPTILKFLVPLWPKIVWIMSTGWNIQNFHFILLFLVLVGRIFYFYCSFMKMLFLKQNLIWGLFLIFKLWNLLKL